MSLGWNTESALLPSKAKKIEIGQQSMLDLKAVVSEKEEIVRQRTAARSGEDGLRQHRGAVPGIGSQAAHKDNHVFALSNRGIEARRATDEEARQAERRKRKRNSSVLEKKALLYDRLKAGGVDPARAKKAGFLVDFQKDVGLPSRFGGGGGGDGEGGDGGGLDYGLSEKEEEGSGLSASNRHAATGREGGDREGQAGGEEGEEVEITDEFGRAVTVGRGSQAHTVYLVQQRAAQAAEVRRQQLEEDAADAAAAARESSGAPPPPPAAIQWPVSSGLAHRGSQQQGSQQQGCAEGRGESGAGGGDGGLGLAEFYPNQEATRPTRAGRSRAADGEAGSVDMGGVNGRVKSRWEMTLSETEKGFLKGIAEETAAGRAKAQAKLAGTSAGGLEAGGQPGAGAGVSSAEGSSVAEGGAAGGRAAEAAAPRAGNPQAQGKAQVQRRRADPKAERRELLRRKREAREAAAAAAAAAAE